MYKKSRDELEDLKFVEDGLQVFLCDVAGGSALDDGLDL